MQGGGEKASEKAEWRSRFLSVREGLSGADRAAASDAIWTRAASLVDRARTVTMFWPLVERGEVDVRPLAARCAAAGLTVGLPMVVSRQPPQLLHRQWTAGQSLVAGRWGVMEPEADAPLLQAEAVDAAIVPVLGAGRDGSRLGYGGGFYDTYLSSTPALRIGVVWAACLVDRLPTEPFDARLDVVVTETETVWTGRRPPSAP